MVKSATFPGTQWKTWCSSCKEKVRLREHVGPAFPLLGTALSKPMTPEIPFDCRSSHRPNSRTQPVLLDLKLQSMKFQMFQPQSEGGPPWPGHAHITHRKKASFLSGDRSACQQTPTPCLSSRRQLVKSCLCPCRPEETMGAISSTGSRDPAGSSPGPCSSNSEQPRLQ